MKQLVSQFVLCCAFATCVGIQAAPVMLNNGNFEVPDLESWAPFTDFTDGTAFFDGLTPGGNPNGYAVIDHEDQASGYGVLVSNFNNALPISEIGNGLQVGRTYTFRQDMKIFPGAISEVPGINIGGLKIDFFSGTNQIGSTGNIYPNMIGDGTTWETYDFNVTIPSGTDGMKVVLLWGEGSVVGFDNIIVDDTPAPAPTSIPNANFEIADGASWGINSDVGTFDIAFPASGGNTGGYAKIEDVSNTGGFAVLVSNDDEIMPLSELGLFPGESYKFSQDMIRLAGPNLGAFKVDFFNAETLISSTGNLSPTTTGALSVWKKYDFTVAIPLNATGIKVVSVAGLSSIIGFDNITYDPTPLIVGPITEIPNGDFETPNRANWFNDSGFGGTFDFPSFTTGGNPAGYVQIAHTSPNTGFGVLVANTNSVIPLSGLGLEDGKAYTFSQDMKIFSGSNVGGLKVEFYVDGVRTSDTGDLRKAVIAPGTDWQTYNYTIPIPLGTDGLKVVLLWGNASTVGYDNITFNPTPVIIPPISNADFELGSAGWSFFQSGSSVSFPTSAGNPNGHARMVNNGGGFGVLVANGNTLIPIENFGITAGETATFRQDMKLFDGSNIGKFKLEYYNTAGGKIGENEKLTPLIGDGSTWETYYYEFDVPSDTRRIKVVLVAGIGSDVGFDNVAVVTPGEDYATWIAGYPEVGSLSGFNDDADFDGVVNGLENFFGTSPSVSSKGVQVESAAGNTFIFTHPQSQNPATDVSAPVYRWSTDLQTYYADGAANTHGTTTVSFSAALNTPSAGITTVTATITGSEIPTKLFIVVGATRNP